MARSHYGEGGREVAARWAGGGSWVDGVCEVAKEEEEEEEYGAA